MSQKIKVYVGCALTGAPKEFVDSVILLKKDLKEHLGVEVLEFLGLEAGTVDDVYKHDIEQCVGTCDVFVAVCDQPSLGLGIELYAAVQRGVPVLAIAHKNSRVTRLVQGLRLRYPNFEFKQYSNFVDVVEMVQGILEKLKNIPKVVH